MSEKIKLVGAKRLNSGGEMFVETQAYIVDDARFVTLMNLTHPMTGYPYFEKATALDLVALPLVDDEAFTVAPRTERPKQRVPRPAASQTKNLDRSGSAGSPILEV